MDFAKAFDSLDWDFFFDVLSTSGFGPCWTFQIKNFLSTGKARILINGSLQGYVRFKRRLRQGDPLSPLLLSLAADSLGAMFTHGISYGVY